MPRRTVLNMTKGATKHGTHRSLHSPGHEPREIRRNHETAGRGGGRIAPGPDKSALRVTDVYDTPQSFESFGKVLVPILSSLGVDVGKPDVVEVHNIVRG